ncbi:hypothetical protein NDU88_004752 [Pleurodeles waltl]|uniref:Uncharacterized protein n=1 Tax=Pleurodeles waltl TaxID=8319 RepID=A0AAV7MUD6_PLEWA|nr:hypothetical protein NDU88_004752 [Pleurodeles waltl]
MEPELLVYILMHRKVERRRQRRRQRTSPTDSDGCPLVMLLMSERGVSAGHVAVQMVVHVAVAEVEILPVLAMVQVSVVVEGDTIPSLAASDG